MSITRFIFALALAAAAGALPADEPPYRDRNVELERRVEDLLGRLTLDEKIDMIGGTNEFCIRGLPRLGVPELRMTDGPLGVRNFGQAIAYPAGIALAASWDVELARRYGAALGRDCRAHGVHFLLGPAVNIQRIPQCGRNFEYFGEDPLLAGRLAAAYVRGVQGQGVAATVKHFAANNHEDDRGRDSSEVDERTLNEIYFPAFRAAVQEAGAWAIMCSYNLLNGTYTSAHDWLMNQVLKKEWGFKGLVMSDWGAAHETLGCVNGGLDLEMPSGRFMNRETIRPLLESGQVAESMLDDKIRRILRVSLAMGWLDRPQQDDSISPDDPQNAAVALDAARAGVVLLKNRDQLLPLVRAKIRTIVVIGPNADPAVVGGGGSSQTRPFHAVSVLDGIRAIAGDGVKVIHLTSASENLEQISSADVAVVCAGFNADIEREGADRSFSLPAGQDQLIAEVSKANPRTIVILNAGGAVDMTGWLDQVPALLYAWYPGQAGGTALAEILFGEVNPSGKLPVSFEMRWEDAAAFGYFPAVDHKIHYREGIFVGYRHFDAKGIEPQFPFGHGLSYTTFQYENLRAVNRGDQYEVTFDVINEGARAGAEVAQLYVLPPKCRAPRPVRELKGFAKVALDPGATSQVRLTLDRSAFAFYDEGSHAWVVEPGAYGIIVASSSRDLRLRQQVEIQ